MLFVGGAAFVPLLGVTFGARSRPRPGMQDEVGCRR
jgi:hypothetical protein